MTTNTIRAFRAKHNLTQGQLAKLLPCSKRAIENWEAETRKPPEYLFRALKDLEGELFCHLQQQNV